MHSEFEMSIMGELNFFIGLQIKQLKEGTFINQAKYIRDLLKRLNMEEAKTMKTPMSSSIKLDKDKKGKSIDSTMYRGMIGFFTFMLPETSLGKILDRLQALEALVLGQFLLLQPMSQPVTTHFRASRAFGSHRRETIASRAQGKRPTEPSQPTQMEAHRKARFDMTLFSSGLFGHMGWLPVVTISEPIFSTLVRAFYLRVTYGLGGPVISIVRGVEIQLDPESICRILDIPPVGLRIYESKAWPTVPGFEPREAIKRMCGLADT
ncbi:hypothetical protein AAG906_007896 [Vitis piasezkii]